MPNFPSRRRVLGIALAAAVAAAGVGAWWQAQKRPARRPLKAAPAARTPEAATKPAAKLPPAAPAPPPAPPIDLEAELRALALRNPMRAIQLAREGLDGPALEQTVLFALRKLASVDLQGAALFVQTMPPDKLQLLATDEIARIYFGLGPQSALSWVNLLPYGSAAHQRALNEVVALWAAQDRAAATRFIEGLPAGALQEGAAARVAAVLGVADAHDAIRWALNLASAGARVAALQAISGNWADKDPAAAARSLAAQSVDIVPPAALHAALAEWLRRDEAGALLFVRTLPRERQMDALLFAAPLAAKQNPRLAAEWAGQFSPRMSEVARAAVLALWLDQDPAAAQAWMNRRLSPAQRAAILAGCK